MNILYSPYFFLLLFVGGSDIIYTFSCFLPVAITKITFRNLLDDTEIYVFISVAATLEQLEKEIAVYKNTQLPKTQSYAIIRGSNLGRPYSD